MSIIYKEALIREFLSYFLENKDMFRFNIRRNDGLYTVTAAQFYYFLTRKRIKIARNTASIIFRYYLPEELERLRTIGLIGSYQVLRRGRNGVKVYIRLKTHIETTVDATHADIHQQIKEENK